MEASKYEIEKENERFFEEYVKKRKHIKTDLVLDTVISDTELCVEGELNY